MSYFWASTICFQNCPTRQIWQYLFHWNFGSHSKIHLKIFEKNAFRLFTNFVSNLANFSIIIQERNWVLVLNLRTEFYWSPTDISSKSIQPKSTKFSRKNPSRKPSPVAPFLGKPTVRQVMPKYYREAGYKVQNRPSIKFLGRNF